MIGSPNYIFTCFMLEDQYMQQIDGSFIAR